MASTTAEKSATAAAAETLKLKEPGLAALLAWLVPGLGHWYQGRHHKAVIYSTCILSTFFFGLYLGEGRVVYASFRANDRRLPYLCQVAAGAVALPAVVQAYRFSDPQVRQAATERQARNEAGFWDWFMVPPQVKSLEMARMHADHPDELDQLNKRLHRYFELGTVYTMLAGLLNILAIYDAGAGPAYGIRWDRSSPSKPPQDDPAPAAA